MSIANPQLPNVSSPRGAPHGRPTHKEGLVQPLRCFRLRFIDDCYDEGGAYWGMPANVYCAMNDSGAQMFCRAESRKKAKRKFAARYGQDVMLRWVN